MGLDIGEKRIGVAVSDAAGLSASALCVLDAAVLRGDQRALTRLIAEYEVDRLIVGLPLALDGTEGAQARRVRASAERLLSKVGTPHEFFDERFSSTTARGLLHEQGVTERQQRGVLDGLAAAVMLQAYLDETRRGDESSGG